MFKPKVDSWITSWNDDPRNRSKVGQLRDSIEETKKVVMDDLEQTIKRGQDLKKTKDRSESLVEKSNHMKKRSKQVKVKMCCRKYMYWIIGILVTLGIGVLLYFLLS